MLSQGLKTLSTAGGSEVLARKRASSRLNWRNQSESGRICRALALCPQWAIQVPWWGVPTVTSPRTGVRPPSARHQARSASPPMLCPTNSGGRPVPWQSCRTAAASAGTWLSRSAPGGSRVTATAGMPRARSCRSQGFQMARLHR